MFAEFMSTYGISLIGSIITAIIGFLGILVKRMIEKYLNTKEKRKVARDVVMFVEQVYKGCHGEEKLNYALEAAKEMLIESGIAFNELEMRVMIESVLAEMNHAFGDAKDSLNDENEDDEEVVIESEEEQVKVEE